MSDICQSPYKFWHGIDLCFVLWKAQMKAVHCLAYIWSFNWDLNPKLLSTFLNFWEGFLLCSPGWPRIPDIDQTGLECVEILLSLPLYCWDCRHVAACPAGNIRHCYFFPPWFKLETQYDTLPLRCGLGLVQLALLLVVLVLILTPRSHFVSQTVLTPTVMCLSQPLSAGVVAVSHQALARLHGLGLIFSRRIKW